jgi:hypothetical protein
MNPVLKALGTMLLKLRYVEPHSNFAFNFNLRRYNGAADAWEKPAGDRPLTPWGDLPTDKPGEKTAEKAGAYTRSPQSSTWGPSSTHRSQ